MKSSFRLAVITFATTVFVTTSTLSMAEGLVGAFFEGMERVNVSYNEAAACPRGTIENMQTGECVDRTCPEGTVENMKTGECVRRETRERSELPKLRKLKPLKTDNDCPAGTVVDRQTQECVSKFDVSREGIRDIQQGLQKFGYYDGAIDGLWGPRSRSALREYQADIGAEPTGTPTKEVAKQLEVNTVLFDLARREMQNRAQEVPDMPDDIHSIRWSSMDPSELYEDVSSSIYVVLAKASRRGMSQGSAVAVSKDHVVTNCHVVDGAQKIAVAQGGEVYEAILGRRQPAQDKCFLAVMGKLDPVDGVRPFSSLEVGETVYTVGSPHGLENSLGKGLISGLRRVNGVQVIQTTAPLSKGSSGGGLFDEAGNLIGVTTAYMEGGQNLNFAIAAEDYWR